MKPKEFNKKLFLNKRTIAHLDKNELDDVYGGAETGSVKECCEPIPTRSCPTNNTNAGGACCCGGDTTFDIC